MRVYTGTKSCGCMVAVMADDLKRDYINETLKEWKRQGWTVRLMELEEARGQLKLCKCQKELDASSTKNETEDKQ
jgi:hypothetical protein